MSEQATAANSETGEEGQRGETGDAGRLGAPGEKGEKGDTVALGDELNGVLAMLESNDSVLQSDLLSDPCIRGMYPAIPASSCKEIHLCNPHRSSGYYSHVLHGVEGFCTR